MSAGEQERTEMRILTIRPPWAHAIVAGAKDVENRTWSTDYRGRVAVHAGQRFDYAAWDSEAFTTWARDYWGMTRENWTGDFFRGGAILGVVDLVDVHHATSCPGRVVTDDIGANLVRAYYASTCSPWAKYHAFHLVLANPRPLPDPIPFKGALGLRELDDDMVARIEAALE